MCPSGGPAQRNKPSDCGNAISMAKENYFPMQLNNWWKYASNQGRTFIYKISKSKCAKNAHRCRMDMYCANAGGEKYDLISSFAYIKRDDMVYIEKIWNYKSERIGEFIFDPSIPFFKLPLKNGDVLKSRGRWGETKSRVFREKLEVMGKTTNAYKLCLLFKPPNGEKEFTNIFWLANNIGIVRLDEWDDYINGYDSRVLIEYKVYF